MTYAWLDECLHSISWLQSAAELFCIIVRAACDTRAELHTLCSSDHLHTCWLGGPSIGHASVGGNSESVAPACANLALLCWNATRAVLCLSCSTCGLVRELRRLQLVCALQGVRPCVFTQSTQRVVQFQFIFVVSVHVPASSWCPACLLCALPFERLRLHASACIQSGSEEP